MENTIDVGTVVNNKKSKKSKSSIIIKIKTVLENISSKAMIKVGLKEEKSLDENSIVYDIIQLQQEIYFEKIKFDFELDEDMIDSHIYHLQGLENKLNCIMKKAKEDKVICNIDEREFCSRI